jgi:HD-GYP domain-containing protein (c-di-GMP phosphodiesterase class II)
MGIDGRQLENLRLAALIHDVGKISVPAEILSKPGRLTETEFELIKVHAQAGHDVLQSIDFESPVATMVLQHHERLDGSGYPSGLRGEEILLEARALAVADVYEAMTSHRPYRPGLPAEDAVAELRSGAGVRYDAVAVEACLRALDEGFAFTAE